MATITLVIKRQRTEYTGAKRWVSIGTATINTTAHTGSVYLNHQDEVWRLFPRKADRPQPHEED